MVSPYLSRPLRSLREALESRETSSEPDPKRRDSRTAAAPAGRNAGRPAEANPLAPRRPFSVVTGGAADASDRDGPRRGGA